MTNDAISGVIESNKALIAKLEDKKDAYNEGIKEALEQKHSIWLKIRSFMGDCKTSNPMHLNETQRKQYDELMLGYNGSKRSYNINYCRHQSACRSLFSLYLDNGNLEAQKMLYD